MSHISKKIHTPVDFFVPMDYLSLLLEFASRVGLG